MTSKVIEAVNTTQDALVRRDVDTYMSYLADDVTLSDPTAPPVHGLEEARKFLEAFIQDMAEITFLERKIFPVGQSAAMKYTIRVKMKNGREGTIEGIDVFELNEQNKIQKVTTYWNPADAAALAG